MKKNDLKKLLVQGNLIYHHFFHVSSRHMEEGRRKTYGQEPDDLELREEFRKPRDSLLSVSAEFYTRSHARLKELRKILADPAFRPPELFDNKAHNVSSNSGVSLAIKIFLKLQVFSSLLNYFRYILLK